MHGVRVSLRALRAVARPEGKNVTERSARPVWGASEERAVDFEVPLLLEQDVQWIFTGNYWNRILLEYDFQ